MIVDVASSALKQSDPHDAILRAPRSGEPLPKCQSTEACVQGRGVEVRVEGRG